MPRNIHSKPFAAAIAGLITAATVSPPGRRHPPLSDGMTAGVNDTEGTNVSEER